MTATSVLDPTAEPLLDEPDRRVCEIPQPAGQFIESCSRLATWTLTGICNEGAKQRLACDDDASALIAFGAHCLQCGGHVSITQAEAVR